MRGGTEFAVEFESSNGTDAVFGNFMRTLKGEEKEAKPGPKKGWFRLERGGTTVGLTVEVWPIRRVRR